MPLDSLQNMLQVNKKLKIFLIVGGEFRQISLITTTSFNRSRQEDSGSNMAVGSGSNKQPPISRPMTTTNGSSGAMNGLNGSGGLVLSSLLAPTPTANGLAQSLAATLANNVSSGGSTSPTNQVPIL
jgi:hypothetical protein